ncbi:MAG: hypothetical protein Q7S40_30750 [Opitutaceae bacterium]|nr:hypothetical protein [Opitutaceae bacterium]
MPLNAGEDRSREPQRARRVRQHDLALMSAAVALLLAGFARAADMTWVYAVQLGASVETSPPRIELTWVRDHLPAETYTVRRKGTTDAAWGEPVILSGDASSFVDESVEAGGRYEYHVSKRAEGTNITAHGYIAVGMQAPLVDDRGRMIVVVDRSVAGNLAAEIGQLEQDLVGDGWTVVRQDVARADRQHRR